MAASRVSRATFSDRLRRYLEQVPSRDQRKGDAMSEIWHTFSSPSPNKNPYPIKGRLVVIHSTRGGARMDDELAATLGWFANPASQVSAHLVIARDGAIWRCVDDSEQAWHCRELNEYAWGIELVQPRITDPFTDAQYHSLASCLRHYRDNYDVPLQFLPNPGLTGVTGHEDTAPGHRDGKTDPGPQFAWTKALEMAEEQPHKIELSEDGMQAIVSHNDVDILRIGDKEGRYPGRIAKLFGDVYFWLRMREDGSAYWSQEEGD